MGKALTRGMEIPKVRKTARVSNLEVKVGGKLWVRFKLSSKEEERHRKFSHLGTSKMHLGHWMLFSENSVI